MTKLHAALVTPLTGPLGLYGKTCATALTLKNYRLFPQIMAYSILIE
jgi:hypothetical protein